ncbi:hypothetical protein HYX08_03445 [Candidatus Woesearchaeota archaeon]|nr:hypothetical protein [Candidatus Woesearchaeota archaeon]
MAKKTLWEEFNLAENNPDQEGGILYAMRYDAERIKAHRGAVVGALRDIGIEFQEVDNLIGMFPKNVLSESETRRVYALAEELSVLNEATEYQEAGFGRFKTWGELKDGLVSHYFSLLLDKKDLVGAYNLATMVIPQIVRDLRIAQAQGKPFSSGEKRTIDDLLAFAISRERQLNHPRLVFIG